MKEKNSPIGKRKSPLCSGTWHPPGGYLKYGEIPEDCAKHEVKEETGIEIEDVEFLAVTNDIFPDGDAKVLEPEKCEEWRWVTFEEFKNMKPLFLPVENLLKNEEMCKLFIRKFLRNPARPFHFPLRKLFLPFREFFLQLL